MNNHHDDRDEAADLPGSVVCRRRFRRRLSVGASVVSTTVVESTAGAVLVEEETSSACEPVTAVELASPAAVEFTVPPDPCTSCQCQRPANGVIRSKSKFHCRRFSSSMKRVRSRLSAVIRSRSVSDARPKRQRRAPDATTVRFPAASILMPPITAIFHTTHNVSSACVLLSVRYN